MLEPIRRFPALACLAAVLLPQALAGFSPARGAMEAAQSRRTFHGHGGKTKKEAGAK